MIVIITLMSSVITLGDLDGETLNNHLCCSSPSRVSIIISVWLPTLMLRSTTSLSLSRGTVQASMHYRLHRLDVVVLVTWGCQFSLCPSRLRGRQRSASDCCCCCCFRHFLPIIRVCCLSIPCQVTEDASSWVNAIAPQPEGSQRAYFFVHVETQTPHYKKASQSNLCYLFKI